VAPDSRKVAQGFAREDLFTVVLEHFQTDTADYADYVLPATTQLEHVDVHGTYATFLWCQPAPIEPLAPKRSRIPKSSAACSEHGFHRAVFCPKATIDRCRSIASAVSQRVTTGNGSSKGLAAPRYTGAFNARLPRAGFTTPSGKCEFISTSAWSDLE